MRDDSERRRTDILQGMLDMVILKTLAPEALHGYAIAQRIRDVTLKRLQVPQGSLYPALHRLENKGLIKGEWMPTATGRDAKVYRLTPKGRRQLEDEVAGWHDLAATMSLVLGSD
ncbi:MAG: PadR family transcriptional regulator [Gemmatimonadales bacterium]